MQKGELEPPSLKKQNKNKNIVKHLVWASPGNKKISVRLGRGRGNSQYPTNKNTMPVLKET